MNSFIFCKQPEPSSTSLASTLYFTLALKDGHVPSLDCRAGLAECGCEVVIGFRAGGELLQDERLGLLAIQDVRALVVREPPLELGAFLRV